jgi:hypothetical protein
MLTAAQQGNSKARVEILSDVTTWIGFDAYFNRSWQTKQLREQLACADVYLLLVGEWAILSFHELAKEEGQWKRERGEAAKLAQLMSIEACGRNISVYNNYSTLPEFAPGLGSVNGAFGQLIEENLTMLRLAEQFLERIETSEIFCPRRLGSAWNCLYLKLLKEYVARTTHWNEAKVLTAITDLVSAAHSVTKRPVPNDLRVLLKKALRHFEENPQNQTLNYLIQMLVDNPSELFRMFPRVPLSRQSRA